MNDFRKNLVKKAFKKLDKDGDGFVTLEEFLAGVGKGKKKK